jgi:thiazole synthase
VVVSGTTLRDVFVDLGGRHPELTGRVLNDSGELRRFMNIYVNENDVRFTGGLATALSDGDAVTILPAVAGGAIDAVDAAPSAILADSAAAEPWLVVGDRRFRSRLIVGIEQYESPEFIRQVLEATEADVFITTLDPDNRRSSVLLSDLEGEIQLDKYNWIGTTSFARTADSALLTVQILNDRYGIDIIKLDVRTPDNRPDNAATITVAERLIRDGLTVLPFILPNPDDARRLEDVGCAAIRLMAAPVASGWGITDPAPLRTIIGQSGIPVVVEGGLATATHASAAMELGASAVLVNTALVRAGNPLRMAEAMKHAINAGRLSYQAQPMAPAAR